MEQLLNEIKVVHLDGEINRLLAAIPEDAIGYIPGVKFNQSEELFMELEDEVLVPRLPIHHDVLKLEPEEAYMVRLRDLIRRISARIPAAFQGLTYTFDPAEILKPCFFRLYKIDDSIYLYLLRLDLAWRPFETTLIEAGSNDVTACYKTSHLYFESEIIPLQYVGWDEGKAKSFTIRQVVSNTWIGESGRGYRVHGVWMDPELTKFFSKLVLPEGVRTYPFYPLFCKYKTICASAPVLRAEYRRKALPLLHRTLNFIVPEMENIQNSLKDSEFSDKMPLFAELRNRVPTTWRDIFQGYATKPYLNDRDMKEFSLEIPDRPD